MTLRITTPLAGNGTRALMGGTIGNFTAGYRLGVEEWKFEPNAPLTEHTNTESPMDTNNVTFYEGFPTKKTTKVTWTFFYDDQSEGNPYQAPVIEAGASVLITRLFLKPSSIAADGEKVYTAMPHFMIPKMWCEGDPITARMGDKLMITASFTITGIWYYPTSTGNTSGT